MDVMSVQTATYTTKDMDDFIYERYLELSKDNEDNFDFHYEVGNTYITKGKADTYPCVIAHTDTVHKIHDNFTVFEKDDIMFAMDMSEGLQVGVGGDDKVGIYVALEMLREVGVIKVAFFRDEEHGCLGSIEADMNWFKNVEFVLQCDRQGYKDFVNTILGDKLFDRPFSSAISTILETYGKKETNQGGLTDVHQLVSNGLDVCVANMSCGYYRPHCDDEVIILNEVFSTRDMVFAIITSLGGKVWKNSLYVDRRKYKAKSHKGKGSKGAGGKRHYTDWSEESKQDWWEGYKYGQGASSWRDLSERHGVKIEQELDYPSSEDFTDEDAFEHYDLETCCSQCGTDEIMFDSAQDADWCFACDEYTNIYSHAGPDLEDELDEEYFNNWLDKEDVNSDSHSLSKSKSKIK